ncbi:CG15431 [Drosophila busckii]|uniref:CG15431 n=2 Tax=Drosophila busckii TaxID=30019 RepID=A0A0M4EPH5_DROBS|nr:CG15431 [Drosophila busckii]
MPLLPPGERNLTDAENAAERARIREEFFATYDVMTGVRIAATLGGFFGLMVFLIVWKSRSSSNETLKVLKDPKMAAVAAVCMQEEEERELQEAIVATGMSIYPDEYDALVYRRQRMLSLGNVSAPPLLNRGYRCGSVGGVAAPGAVGYSYLLEPPRRFSYSAVSAGGASAGPGRRKSGSESSRIFSNYPMGGSFGTDDYFMETDDELEQEEYMQRDARDEEREEQQQQHHHQRNDSTRSKQGFLSVPMPGHDSRRSSAMTCCSTDSSYLERRTSAYTLGMSNLPPTLQRKLSTASRTSSIENWDYYYPDIQVIQPTPKASPCPSERSLHEPSKTNCSVLGTAALSAPSFKPKHSIVSYDPESAQAGRKQQIHSISADTVDVYPYNQAPELTKAATAASPEETQELRLGVGAGRKLTLVELQRNVESNNNSFPYTANVNATTATATVTSSSISVDSTPVSLERLNGSLSMNLKRAPLASLSSFKISSLECADSELRSLEEDSVFAADTDDDMQQLSSDSEEQSIPKPKSVSMAAVLPLKRLSLTGARPRRPQLQRHRTIGACPAEAVTPPPAPPPPPLETHFGLNVAVAPTQRPRGELLQQHSDTQTTTTNTTEEDTCSTLNTELDVGPHASPVAGGESATHTQYSSLNTVISLTPNTQLELPLGHDACASSISDSIICMPASLKQLILRGGNGGSAQQLQQEHATGTPAVVLELPLIRLPLEQQQQLEQEQQQQLDVVVDPSLPGTSRKWSKETLF